MNAQRAAAAAAPMDLLNHGSTFASHAIPNPGGGLLFEKSSVPSQPAGVDVLTTGMDFDDVSFLLDT